MFRSLTSERLNLDSSISAQETVENLLHVLYHPFFNTGHPIQNELEQYMQSWIDHEDKHYTLNALTKDSVRHHKNHRKGHATDQPTVGPGGYQTFLPTPTHLQQQASNYVHQQVQGTPGYQQYHQTFPGRNVGPTGSSTVQAVPLASVWPDQDNPAQATSSYGPQQSYGGNTMTPTSPVYQQGAYMSQQEYTRPPHPDLFSQGPPPPAWGQPYAEALNGYQPFEENYRGPPPFPGPPSQSGYLAFPGNPPMQQDYQNSYINRYEQYRYGAYGAHSGYS